MKRAAVVVVLLFAVQALAQTARDSDWQPDSSDGRSFAKTIERYPDRSRFATYITALEEVRAGLHSNSVWNDPITRGVHDALDFHLTAAVGELTTTSAALGSDASTAEGASQYLLNGFTPERFAADAVTLSYFDAAGTHVVSDEQLQAIPLAAVEDFKVRTDTAYRLLRDMEKPAFATTASAIARINKEWDLFINHGPAQFPWESFINGHLITTRFDPPPSHQWIIAHPMVAVEITKRSLSDLRADQSIAVEALGHAWYRFAQPPKEAGLRWFGIAAAVGIHADRKPSWGVIGHYNRAVTAGLLWQSKTAGVRVDDPTIVLGVDLYQLVQKKVPEYRDRLRKISGAK
ncbi:MAG TPA: hypothetical protein VLV78_20370 [Thermoanaerobaculia bacterium]|nr:hypothetical protein [Thermoanaerobaculia bacterium]